MDLNGISSDTLEAIKKSATNGMLVATGLQGYDLRDVISLVPAPSTFYNQLAHTSPDQGSDFTTWRVLTNINNQQANPATPFEQAAPLHKNNLITVSAAYAKLGYGYTVTKDAMAKAKGFADAKALEVYGAMNLYKVGTDKMSLFGSNVPLGTPATPSVTPATTGGTIAGGTAVAVKVAARTGTNYNYGGSTAASAAGTGTTATTGATNSAVAKTAAVVGAVAYDWFVGNFYYTTTVVNTVTITSVPTANQAVPNLPGLFATAPASVPATDSSANPNEFNGLLTTLSGDYATGGASGLVQRGSGTPSGATFQSLDGAGFTGSGQNINELDALNAALFQSLFVSPSAYMCSSVDAASISKLLLATAGGGTTFFTPGNDGRSDVTAGGFIGHYINKAAGGKPVRIEVHPNMIPGTLIARTDQLDLPNSNISNVFEIRDLEAVQDYEYGVSRLAGAGGGPRFDGEVYSESVLVNRAPIAQGVLSNIGS